MHYTYIPVLSSVLREFDLGWIWRSVGECRWLPSWDNIWWHTHLLLGHQPNSNSILAQYSCKVHRRQGGKGGNHSPCKWWRCLWEMEERLQGCHWDTERVCIHQHHLPHLGQSAWNNQTKEVQHCLHTYSANQQRLCSCTSTHQQCQSCGGSCSVSDRNWKSQKGIDHR